MTHCSHPVLLAKFFACSLPVLCLNHGNQRHGTGKHCDIRAERPGPFACMLASKLSICTFLTTLPSSVYACSNPRVQLQRSDFMPGLACLCHARLAS
jgi:hypothetical protein